MREKQLLLNSDRKASEKKLLSLIDDYIIDVLSEEIIAKSLTMIKVLLYLTLILPSPELIGF